MKNWKQQALARRRVVVRTARRAGKTSTAVKWARSAGKRVLYVVPYETMGHHAFEDMRRCYQGEIQSTTTNPHRITFTDGNEVHFLSRIDQARGARYDAVVIDEVSYLNEDDVILALATAADQIDFPFFVTHTKELGRGTAKRFKKMEEVAPIDYISIDYLDLLQDGVYLASDVRTVKDTLSAHAFEEEYGPWFAKEAKPRNSFFKHLLDKERA